MEVTDFLSCLSGVRKNGARKDSWVAKCPAHEDRSPSLSVGVADDGRVLMHCFAGCGTDAVLGALGIEMIELIPEHMRYVREREQRIAPRACFSAMDGLRCLDREAVVLTLIASDIASGRALTQDDVDRVAKAAGRIGEVLRLSHGG